MFQRNNSYSHISSIQKIQANQNNMDRYNYKSDYNKNSILNSYQNYCRTHKHYHPNANVNANTITASFSRDYKSNTITKQTNTKTEFNNEDIKKIYEAIDDIKKNQRELITVIKIARPIKEMKNKIVKKKEEDKKEDKKVDKKGDNSINVNELLSSFNKLKEDLEKMKEEISIMKKNEEENKKIMELNKSEIENLKKNIQQNNKDNSDILIEKDKEIKKLKESLQKSENEKSDLSNINKQKDDEIKSLKKQLEESKSKIELSQKLNDLNDNVEIIKQSIENKTANINQKPKDNLLKSTSLDLEPNSKIIFKDSLYTAAEKKDA
jgi:chromosome segregation ATPase